MEKEMVATLDSETVTKLKRLIREIEKLKIDSEILYERIEAKEKNKARDKEYNNLSNTYIELIKQHNSKVGELKEVLGKYLDGIGEITKIEFKDEARGNRDKNADYIIRSNDWFETYIQVEEGLYIKVNHLYR